MADKLNSLIMALENTDTYDRENALIDLYIFLISQNSSLPKVENTFIFVELSNWRDCSLRDGVESYYETKDTDELNFLEKNMKQYARHEVCKKCISGIHIQKENANCKCKLDTCTVELSESERRSGWKPLASVLGDAAAAFGCVNRVEELVKQLLRGAVAKLLARPSVQFISCSQDILSRESLNGHALRNEGSKQPVVTFVLGTFPRGVGMRKVDCTAPVLDLTERRELRAVVHGNGLEDL